MYIMVVIMYVALFTIVLIFGAADYPEDERQDDK